MSALTEKLFKQYYRILCHYAWQYLKDIEVSKDLVQDVFTSFHQRKFDLNTEKNEDYFRNYLYLSVRNACFNLLKKKQVQEKYWQDNNFEEQSEHLIELNIIRSEVLAAVYSAIESLPESCQLIFKKTYLEGLSNAEVAEELNLSINTIKTQKQRGMKALKAKLNPDLIALFLLLIKF